MTNKIIADTNQLRSFARQIDDQIEKIRKINNRLNYIKIDMNTSIEEKEKAYRIGSLNVYKTNLSCCSNYLKVAAKDIENVENALIKIDILNFSSMFMDNAININFLGSTWITLSKDEKNKIWEMLEKTIGVIDEDLKNSLDALTIIYEYLLDPSKEFEIKYEVFTEALSEYLGELVPGVLNGLGIGAFINMVERFPGELSKAQKIIDGRITDIDAWIEYGAYLGEHVFVDGVLEYAGSTIDGVLDLGTGVLKYFGVEIDVSLDDVYEHVLGEGGLEGYKKGMEKLGSTLWNSASNTYFKDADSIWDYGVGTVEIIKDGCAIWGQWASDIFKW